MDQILLGFHFGCQSDKRHHDLRYHFDPFAIDLAGGFHDRLHLHPRDFGHRDPQTAAPESQHGIELVEFFDAPQQFFLLLPKLRILFAMQLGDLHHEIFTLGEKLMQRRIQ